MFPKAPISLRRGCEVVAACVSKRWLDIHPYRSSRSKSSNDRHVSRVSSSNPCTSAYPDPFGRGLQKTASRFA